MFLWLLHLMNMSFLNLLLVHRLRSEHSGNSSANLQKTNIVKMTKEKKRLASEREMANVHFHFVGRGRKRPRLIHKKREKVVWWETDWRKNQWGFPPLRFFVFSDELRFDNYVKSKMNWKLTNMWNLRWTGIWKLTKLGKLLWAIILRVFAI